MVIAESFSLTFDVEYLLDVTAEIDDFFLVVQVLSAIIDELEFSLVLEIFRDDEFCHFSN